MDLTRQPRAEYIAENEARVAKAFEQHVIRSRDHRSWVCQRPYTDERGGWDSTYWFEVIVLAGGELFVHGDIDCMHFAHYGKYQNVEEVLGWMGATRDVGYYVSQKAYIGMGSVANKCVESVDERVWFDDALDFIEEAMRQRMWSASADAGVDDDGAAVVTLDVKTVRVDDLPISDELKDLIRDVLESSSAEEVLNDPKHMSAECYEAGAFEWGKVPSHRLLYAHGALRCLVRLLDAERAERKEAANE